MTTEIKGIQFELLYQKALYRRDENLLIIADIHLGKAHHFRKSGIPFPAQAQQSDYERLEELFVALKPQKVYFLGDLFHSSFNRDWHHFCDLIGKFPDIIFILVKGNHDLIDEELFREKCIDVVHAIEDGFFIYTHAPLDDIPAGKVNIVGHVHPGFTLSGAGRQSIKLPCFYVTADTVIVPAFGILTGLYNMPYAPESKIYIVLPDHVKAL